MKTVQVTLTVNGQEHSLEVPGNERLLDTLRERLRLTGTKEGCGVGECGACSVILNGQLVNSCLVLTAQCQDARVETVEGLGAAAKLSRLQQAFIDHNAVQCGFCTRECSWQPPPCSGKSQTYRPGDQRGPGRGALPLHRIPADYRGRPGRR